MGSEIGRRRGAALRAVSLSAATLSALVSGASMADVYTIASGHTEATPRSVTGTDRVNVEAGAVLDTDGDTAIEWHGASPAAGVTIDNAGSILSRKRGIDTDGDDSERSLTLYNGAGAIIDTGNDVFRVDTDLSDGEIIVDNAGTLHSAGGQVLDFASIESPTAVVTISNAESGVIEADDNDAIRPGAGKITIDNAGRILSTASASRGIHVADVAHLAEFHLRNERTGVIESTDDAVRIDSDGGSRGDAVVTVDNYGLILSSGTGDDGGQAIDFDHIEAGQARVTINNYAGGEIRAEDADALRPGAGATVNNAGSIVANSSEPDASNDGVDLQDHAATIHNLAGGTISGARHGITTDVEVTVYNAAGATIRGRNGSGVGSDGNGTVVNAGLISGDIDSDSELGDGDGVDIDFIGHITNRGTIRGTGAKGQKPGDTPNQSEGIAMGGGTIVNASESALIRGADNGILIDDGSSGGAYGETTIINRGTIEGIDGYGISLVGDYDDTVVNSGRIAGGNGLALDLGGGDDTLVVQSGATFDGRIDGGDGVDTILLDGEGVFAGGDNVELLSVKGDWRLTGTQRYADGIDITGGSRLDLDGTLDGPLAVAADGLLGGNGTLGSVTVKGTISPGNSVGQLNVVGDYRQTAGSTYRAEIEGAGRGDRIHVSGTASLAGELAVTPLSDAAYAPSRYTLVSAAGGVTGAYDAPESYSPFFDLDLDYQANAVVLDVARNDTRFADLAATDNQRASAAGIESLGAGNGIYDAVIATTDIATLRQDYDALSGEIHASTRSGLIEESRFVREAVFGRLRRAGSAPHHTSTGAASALGKLPDQRPGMWLQGFGGWGRSDGDGNATGLERSTRGLFVGIDRVVGASEETAWQLGVAGGYGRSDYDVDRRDSSSEIDSYTLAAYAGRSFGPVGLRLGAAHAWHDIDTRRAIDVADAGTAKASYEARTAQLFGEVGIALTAGRTRLEPYAGLAYVDLHSDGYQERGAAGLDGEDGDAEVTYSTLGLRTTTPFEIGGASAVWQAAAGWQHAFGQRTPTAEQAFRGGETFAVDGIPVGEDAITLATGIDMALSPATSVGVDYTGRLASDARDQSVDANLTIRF